ncbi:hypothetical protein DEO72_LG4g843 [Vigna unguiculata]|uniref:Secreted protein n=1 Tax=Vigna unguiculata TaxID=3917 RepID=A0A4D6LMX9_VIGUN|nr:hypothetical protein DEO72_LG4g843 [Vigna unguiculata]
MAHKAVPGVVVLIAGVYRCLLASFQYGKCSGVNLVATTCMRAGSERERLGCFTTDEESVGLDYEQDRLMGLDHEWVSFVGAQ